MKKPLRITLKCLLWIIVFAGLLFVLQVTVLAFPSPWFDQSVSKGNLTIYAKGLTVEKMESIVDNVDDRVEAVELYDKDVKLRVFVCPNQGLYNLFARLSLVPNEVPGFNLSILNNSFVSTPILDRRRASSYGHIEYSALAGDLAQCIAHELIHDYTQERIGILAYRKIPAWKTEGYAEYSASRAAISEDGASTLSDRIRIMQTDVRDQGARDYYRWGLIVEYLSVELGYSFADIMSDDVTLASAGAQMTAWFAESQ
jgi:hypothetical protein